MKTLAILFVLAFATLAVGEEIGEETDELRASVIDTDVDRIPEQTVAPKYPRKARRDRVEGEVQVCFDIDRKGRPRRVAVRRSTHRDFERPSIRAVKASRFRALADDQDLQSIKSCRTFVFSLQSIDSEAGS